MLYIKIALVAIALAAIIGVVWYIKATFTEKERLVGEKARLEFQIQQEQQKVVVAMEQLKIWQETVARMNAAIKNIKIESNTYVQGIDNEPSPEFNGRKSLPLILSTMSTSPPVPGYANHSSSRTSTTTPPR
jgi:hypothetical protein